MTYEIKSGADISGKLFIPSMTNTERTSLSNLKPGTLVWDTVFRALFAWDGSSWIEHSPFVGHQETILTGTFGSIEPVDGEQDRIYRFQGLANGMIDVLSHSFNHSAIVWLSNETNFSLSFMSSSGVTLTGATTVSAYEMAMIVYNPTSTNATVFIVGKSTNVNPRREIFSPPTTFVSIPNTNMNFMSPFSITVPAAGTWRVYANVTCLFIASSASIYNGIMMALERSDTNTIIPESYGRLLSSTNRAGGMVRLEAVITTTGAISIKLMARREPSSTITASYINNNSSEGRTILGYEELL